MKVDRVAIPMFASNFHPEKIKARDLKFELCQTLFAVRLVESWHSRLPACQAAPWQFAFHAYCNDVTYAVALWNNPSARTLPHNWLELRRLAAAPDAPNNTCSRFIGWMVRYFRQYHHDRERCISYQDPNVHTGTIYKASNWKIEYEANERVRDRTKNRVGTGRKYRTNVNGEEVDSVGKIRWGISL